MKKPEKLHTFMYAMFKEVTRYSLYDLYEDGWDMSEHEVDECLNYVEDKLGIDFYRNEKVED